MSSGSAEDLSPGARHVVDRQGLDALIGALAGDGYRVIGPRLRDSVIAYEEIVGVADLPAGWTDVQEAGTYRLERRADDALFGYAVGPHSWKRYLHPAQLSLWRAERVGGEMKLADPEPEPARFAFIGVRSCDLHAIRIQDRVLTGGPFVDPHYRDRRRGAFIVAVNCSEAGGTCFCVSMGTGPRADQGFDLALTEIGADRFVVATGSEEGGRLLARLPGRPASPADIEGADAVVARTAASMGREMQTDGLPALLLGNLDHPRWEEVAGRCLTCGNCTMVCPTCFCTSVEDSSDLSGLAAERTRRWDSCFTMDFSYIHGGSVRASPKSRYRQWMTHKLATWWEQFDSSGCVGCGRCITWCPVGIDITEEARAIRQHPQPEQREAA
ncbi:MAG TPA: 4Fe-4S dicluster domain-containing protein [Bauldia sp.]|nr:4Fe-4S dicluster domain-containing protein [Bauldia sp.]